MNYSNRNARNTALTGLALGVAAGTMVYAVNNMATSSQKKMMKKTADKAMKNVGSFLDDVTYMLK